MAFKQVIGVVPQELALYEDWTAAVAVDHEVSKVLSIVFLCGEVTEFCW
jgi:hypothetical protein